MPKLPAVSGREAVAIFERTELQVVRRRGSHIIMTRRGHAATLSIPDHPHLKPGTLRALIRKAGLSVGEFLALMD